MPVVKVFWVLPQLAPRLFADARRHYRFRYVQPALSYVIRALTDAARYALSFMG